MNGSAANTVNEMRARENMKFHPCRHVLHKVRQLHVVVLHAPRDIHQEVQGPAEPCILQGEIKADV